jgi:hypothetical protein
MFKVGDKVKMTKRGLEYYANPNQAFRSNSVKQLVNKKQFESAVCELFAVRGIGEVVDTTFESPKIKWTLRLNGMYFYYTHYFDFADFKKASLLDRIIVRIKGML